MNKTLIWSAVGIAVIGIGVPAYAAVQTTKPLPSITTVKTTVEDVRGNCDEAEHSQRSRLRCRRCTGDSGHPTHSTERQRR